MLTDVTGGAPAHHVLRHDGGLRRLAGGLVVVLEGHDEHGVRVLAELHQVRHPADDRARLRSREKVVLLMGP